MTTLVLISFTSIPQSLQNLLITLTWLWAVSWFRDSRIKSSAHNKCVYVCVCILYMCVCVCVCVCARVCVCVCGLHRFTQVLHRFKTNYWLTDVRRHNT